MVDQKLGRQEGIVEVAEPALKPWAAPILTVHSVNDVTRAGTTSSKNDGVTVYSPS